MKLKVEYNNEKSLRDNKKSKIEIKHNISLQTELFRDHSI